MKKILILIALILMASLAPPPVLASGESRIDGGYTNVTNLRIGTHIEMSAEIVVVDGDLRYDSGIFYQEHPYEEYDQYPARYKFEEDGVIKNLFLMYGGANSFAVPDFFASITMSISGAESANAIKIDYAHIPIGDYEFQKNGEIWFNDWNFPVSKGDVVWIQLWVKKNSPEGDTWWGGRAAMLFEPDKKNNGR